MASQEHGPTDATSSLQHLSERLGEVFAGPRGDGGHLPQILLRFFSPLGWHRVSPVRIPGCILPDPGPSCFFMEQDVSYPPIPPRFRRAPVAVLPPPRSGNRGNAPEKDEILRWAWNTNHPTCVLLTPGLFELHDTSAVVQGRPPGSRTIAAWTPGQPDENAGSFVRSISPVPLLWRVARHDRILPGESDENASTLQDALACRVKYWKEGIERILRSADPGLDHEAREVRTIQTVFNLILAHIDTELGRTPGYPASAENGTISSSSSLSSGGIDDDRFRRLWMHDFGGPSLLFSPIPPELYSRVFSVVLNEKEHRFPKKRKMPHHEPQIAPSTPGAVIGLAAGLLSDGLHRDYEGMNPFRVLDPCCRTGTFLLELSAMFHGSMDGKGGVRENKTKQQNSGPGIVMYGVDPDPVRLECTKFVLFLQRSGCSGSDTGETAGLLSHYRRDEELPGVSLVRGNAIIGTDILTDIFRAETGSLQEQRLSPLDWTARFPWVNETGFDGIGGEFLFPPDRLTRTVRDYLARRYRSFRPDAGLEDCYLERTLELLGEGGMYSALLPGNWLSAAADADARRLISGKEILTVLEYGPERHGTISHRGEGYCIVTGRNAPPKGFVGVMRASTGRAPGPLVIDRGEIPAPAGKGGWSLRDPRLGELRAQIASHGTPLSRYLLGEISRGTLPEGFRQETPRSAPETGHPASSRPYARSSSVIPYVRLVPDGYLATDEPCGVPSTAGQPGGPGTAPESSRENSETGELVIATGALSLRATIGPPGMCYDGGILHAPHPDLYLVGVINSSVARFYMVFDEGKTPGRPGGTAVSRAMAFPVHVIDPASAEESRTGERIRMLVERMFLLALLARGPDMDASGRLAVRIGHTAMAIDSLVCRLYGIDPARKKMMDEYLDRYPGPREGTSSQSP